MPLLTVAEAANELRVSRSTLYGYMKGNHPLEYKKPRGRRFFTKDDIENFINNKRLEKI
jgi:excisionase family DNA binding protein